MHVGQKIVGVVQNLVVYEQSQTHRNKQYRRLNQAGRADVSSKLQANLYQVTGGKSNLEGLVALPSSVGVLTVDLKCRTYMLRWFRLRNWVSAQRNEYSTDDKTEKALDCSVELSIRLGP